MLTDLYQALATKLNAVPGIAHVDLWNQQLRETDKPYEGAQSDWPTPAVFVELVPSDWRSSGRHVQRATVTVRLWLITERYQATDLRTAAPERAAALATEADLTATLSAKVTGWRMREPGAGGRVLATSFTRTRVATDSDFTNVVETQLEFRTELTDYTAVRPSQPISPALVITPRPAVAVQQP